MKRFFRTAALLLTLALTACTPAPDSSQAGTADLPYAEGQLYAAAWLGWQETGDLPRYPDTRLEISQLDISTSEARLVYTDPDCEALILQCNISDIFPDAQIRLQCEEGEAEFSPYISLRDGSVVLSPEGLDITRE